MPHEPLLPFSSSLSSPLWFPVGEVVTAVRCRFMIEYSEHVLVVRDEIFPRLCVTERRLAARVADGAIPAQSLFEHAQEHWYFAVDIVEDANLALPGVESMEATGVLHESAPPRHRQRKK